MKSKKTIFIIQESLCSTNLKNITMYKQFYSKLSKIPVKDINIICNPSKGNVLYDIAKTYFGYTPSTDNQFIDNIIENISEYLNENYKVLVYGISYGGAIISEICQKIHSHKNVNNLWLASFGSLYTIGYIENINLVQYMYADDINLNYNHLDKKYYNKIVKTKKSDFDIFIVDLEQNILWIKNFNQFQYKISLIEINLTSFQVNYHILMNNLIFNNSIDITDIQSKYSFSKMLPEVENVIDSLSEKTGWRINKEGQVEYLIKFK